MHKNQIWLAFLAAIALITLWFSGMTGYELYNYLSLSSKVLPLEVNWSVTEKSTDHYVLLASYKFKDKDVEYAGVTEIEHIPFKKANTAEQMIPQYMQKKWIVWYASFNPERSSILKFFPLKSCLYTAILWGLLFYFIWLGFYVGRFKSQTNPGDLDNAFDRS